MPFFKFGGKKKKRKGDSIPENFETDLKNSIYRFKNEVKKDKKTFASLFDSTVSINIKSMDSIHDGLFRAKGRNDPIYLELKRLNLQEYAMAFIEEKIIVEQLSELTDEELIELIPDKIPRRRFKNCFQNKDFILTIEEPILSEETKQEKLIKVDFSKIEEKIFINSNCILEYSESTIAQGSFGRIMKGKFQIIGEESTESHTVAVKEINVVSDIEEVDVLKKEITEEVKINCALSEQSSQIIKCFGCFFVTKDSQEYAYVITEFCENGDLDNFKTNLKTEEDKLITLLQIAKGMACMHKFNIIHRDLKPQNVLVDSLKEMKITDFGTSKAVASIQSTLCGTISFIDPQAYFNKKAYSKPNDHKKLDCYSFGISAWEIWTGQKAFSFEMNEFLKLKKIFDEKLIPDLSLIDHKEIREMVKRCLSRNITKRPSFEMITKGLDLILEELEERYLEKIEKNK